MLDEDLIRDYPVLYHMAEAKSWPSIARHGLLSTTALLDRSDLERNERYAIESKIRPESVPIKCGRMGDAVIRDQKPLKERALRRLLPPRMTVPKYCRLLNARTFFWADEERLNTMLNAKAYRARPHDVLVVDTRGLVGRHRDGITLSHINSGATSRGAKMLGPGTFRRIDKYGYSSARRHGGNRVAEVAVDYMVPDIRRFVLRVERRRGNDILGTVWKRGEKARAPARAGARPRRPRLRPAPPGGQRPCLSGAGAPGRGGTGGSAAGSAGSCGTPRLP